MTDQATEESTSINEENVLQHILDKHVAPQEEDSEVENTEASDDPIEEPQEELIGDDSGEESPYEDDESQEEPLYKVTLAGGEVAEVTEDELLKGYSRNDDYTRKSMANADERKALEASRQEVEQQRERLMGQMDVFISDKEAQLKQAESLNLVKLHEEDPDQAAQLKYMIDATRDEVAKAKAAREQQEEEARADYNSKFKEYLEAQQTVLLKRMPQLSDAKKAKEVFGKVNKALSNHGFSDEEISKMVDARAVEMAHKAALWDEAQAKRPEVVKKAGKLPKYQKSGSPRGRSAESKAKYDNALKNARESGGDKGSVENLILSKLKLKR